MMLEDIKINGNDKDYLVDVMRVWDYYAQDWMPDSPVLLRFESDDVLVLADGRVFVGPVLTEKSFEESIPEEMHAYVDVESIGAEDKCLCWLCEPQARELIGDYMSASEALALELGKSRDSDRVVTDALQ